MKALSNIIQRIDAKYLFLAGGTSVVSGFAATIFSESSIAVWLFLTCIASAIAFAGLIAIKIVFGIFSATASIARGSRARPSHKSKRNVPLIIVGLITLIAVSSLRSSIGGGIAVSIIQVCALVIVLYGFGMSWTRKNKQYGRISAKHSGANHAKEQTETAKKTKGPVAYGTILQGVTITIVDDLRKKHRLTELQENNLAVRIMGFCIIILMREFQKTSVEPRKSREFISEVLRTIARNSNPPELEQKAYTELNRIIGGLSREYGSLPLSNTDSSNLKGTLLWEYSKLMNETMGKDKNDLILLMENTSVIANLNQAIDTQDIVTALQTSTTE